MTAIDWSVARDRAQRRYEERAAAMPFHKMPAWEGLAPIVRAELILRAAMEAKNETS